MQFNPVEIIKKKRDGQKLSFEEISFFVKSSVEKKIPEYQVSAWLMAIYFKGLDAEETVHLTECMISSGKRAKFNSSSPKVDKHSTGGVGDKVSLVLAPLVAAMGSKVPMVAGRGLGHTGGTIDKLEAIPGFKTKLEVSDFIHKVETHGVAIMGQSDEFVPADRLFYSLRDVTATVESIPLITASILSKKVAEGISGLLMDIKVGSGAFMKSQKDAEKLARSIVSVGKKLGLKIRALITDMNQPLGNTAGHSIEVLECFDVLNNKGPSDLKEICIESAAQMAVLSDLVSSLSAGRTLARKCLSDGSAQKKFFEMCNAQGASVNADTFEKTIKISSNKVEVKSIKTGTITKMNTQGIGQFLLELGGGRKKTTDNIDYSVGIRFLKKLGDSVEKGEAIAVIYFNPQKIAFLGKAPNDYEKDFQTLIEISKKSVLNPKLIKKMIS